MIEECGYKNCQYYKKLEKERRMNRIAKECLAELTGGSVDDSLDSLTIKLIFGKKETT